MTIYSSADNDYRDDWWDDEYDDWYSYDEYCGDIGGYYEY